MSNLYTLRWGRDPKPEELVTEEMIRRIREAFTRSPHREAAR